MTDWAVPDPSSKFPVQASWKNKQDEGECGYKAVHWAIQKELETPEERLGPLIIC